MPNNIQDQQKKKINFKSIDSVLFTKLLIIVAVVIMLIAFIVLGLAQTFFAYNITFVRQLGNANLNQSQTTSTNEYNFQAPLPSAQAGDISNVSKEKIDTLFNNLKK